MRKIKLFWWSPKHLNKQGLTNFGDEINVPIIQRITNKEVVWVSPYQKKRWFELSNNILFSIGSILHFSSTNSIVWGSGIISHEDKISKPKRIHAVRGPQTYKHLKSLGYECPEIFGDPGILLPLFFNPNRKSDEYIGIIPHFTDYEFAYNKYKNKEGIKVINLCTDFKSVINEINECKFTFSSSLHGIITSHAYNIPSLWIGFLDQLYGTNIKFTDYFESVGIKYYERIKLNNFEIKDFDKLINNYYMAASPPMRNILQLQKGLIDSFPKYL